MKERMLKLKLWIIESLLDGKEKTAPEIRNIYEDRYYKISIGEKRERMEREIGKLEEKLEKKDLKDEESKKREEELKKKEEEISKIKDEKKEEELKKQREEEEERRKREEEEVSDIKERIRSLRRKMRDISGSYLIDQHIYREGNILAESGILEIRRDDNNIRKYKFKGVGCVDGMLIAKMHDGERTIPLPIVCGKADICECPIDEHGLRSITDKCRYYKALKKLKPEFTLRF